MKYSQARQGRVFVIRLEDGDIVHESIERVAKDECVRAGVVTVVGGAGRGSKLVVGPEADDARPANPMEHLLNAAHEVTGTGTLFPDETGEPILHLHMACGRNASTITGCVRRGVIVWQVMEAILIELTDCCARRVPEPKLGFKLMIP